MIKIGKGAIRNENRRAGQFGKKEEDYRGIQGRERMREIGTRIGRKLDIRKSSKEE